MNNESVQFSEVNELNQKLTEKISKDGTIIEGYFNQKLKGGTIHKSKQIYVPEKIVRELALNNGDFVRAIFQKYLDKYKNRSEYKFEIIERTTKDLGSSREIVTMTPLKKHPELNRLFIEFTPDNSELPVTSLISDYDISKYYLSEGDIIDYAYESTNPISGSIIWKYRIENLPITQEKNVFQKEY